MVVQASQYIDSQTSILADDCQLDIWYIGRSGIDSSVWIATFYSAIFTPSDLTDKDISVRGMFERAVAGYTDFHSGAALIARAPEYLSTSILSYPILPARVLRGLFWQIRGRLQAILTYLEIFLILDWFPWELDQLNSFIERNQ